MGVNSLSKDSSKAHKVKYGTEEVIMNPNASLPIELTRTKLLMRELKDQEHYLNYKNNAPAGGKVTYPKEPTK